MEGLSNSVPGTQTTSHRIHQQLGKTTHPQGLNCPTNATVGRQQNTEMLDKYTVENVHHLHLVSNKLCMPDNNSHAHNIISLKRQFDKHVVFLQIVLKASEFISEIVKHGYKIAFYEILNSHCMKSNRLAQN